MTDSQKRMLDYAKRIAYSSVETLMFTFEMAQKYADSEGCYVECGVAAGAQIIAMRAGAPNKRIHAFDSFEGIPLPSNRDDQMPGIKFLSAEEQAALPDPGKQELKTTGATSVSMADFFKHLKDSGADIDGIHAHTGWFENTVPAWTKSAYWPISILRLDGDLYNSTYVCLDLLYPMVESGGIVIIDDWELPGSRAAVHDYFAHLLESNDFPRFYFISNIAYFIKP